MNLKFSADASWVAICDRHLKARLACLADSDTFTELPCRGAVLAAFCTDDKHVIVCTLQQTVKVYNRRTLALITQFVSPSRFAAYTQVAVSPNRDHIACRDPGSIDVWQLSTGCCVQQLVTHQYNLDVLCLAFSPCGERLVSGARDGTAQLWNIQSGERIATLSGHTAQVLSVAFSPPPPHWSRAQFSSYPRCFRVVVRMLVRGMWAGRQRAGAVCWLGCLPEELLDTVLECVTRDWLLKVGKGR
jgi:WD40 repeat protein